MYSLRATIVIFFIIYKKKKIYRKCKNNLPKKKTVRKIWVSIAI